MRRLALIPIAAVVGVAGTVSTAAAMVIPGHRDPAPRHAVPRAGHRAQSLPVGLPAFPTVTTGSASGLTPTTATLTGSISPSDWSVAYEFQYGPTTSYGASIPNGLQAVDVSSYTSTALGQTLTGLTPATTYHYRVVAAGELANLVGLVDGSDQTFTTPAAVPLQPPTTTVVPTTPTTTTSTTTSTTSTSPSTTGTTPAPVSTSTTPTAVPAPVVGKAETIGAASGTVTVTLPGSSVPIMLSAEASIPLGAVVDATHGVAEVSNALADGRVQKVSVWDGRFTMSQTPTGRTWFHLVGAPSCPSGRRAHAAGPRSVSLWAHDHHGRYGTRGDNSVATVRGTEWKTTESCAGTRTTVRIGEVNVRDLHTGRSVVVSAGHSVLVRR